MAYEQKPNTASMFKNDRKEADTHADFRGSALIEGQEYYVDCWLNTGAKGEYYSMKFKPKAAKSNDNDDTAPF
ncbi:hypothetical protein LZG74_25405 [Dyadobacter sp. CY327]|uniref:hypothetical protein n=1 Tax=Dyadobacter sp. CY327 TaxID=2907301 RepID=UPI001F22FE2F|nr:hypothetical protein [Dyadobacter sp. CY327]MCE7073672.1 hypothetical protein [Dyadobacter sp. CY327]